MALVLCLPTSGAMPGTASQRVALGRCALDLMLSFRLVDRSADNAAMLRALIHQWDKHVFGSLVMFL